ncbi:hypothetical protein D3C87_943980 [compost metagenome]
MLGKRGLHPVLHHAARQFAQFDRFERRARLRLVFRARQGQQLVDEARGRFRTFRQLQQRAVDLVVVGLAQGQLRLHAHAGQRCLHLVRGIGDEAFLHVDRQRQPREHLVERTDQRRDFLGYLARFDRTQIVRWTGAYAFLQLRQRRQAARQGKPDEGQDHGQDDELRQNHALDDFIGQLGAFFQRLGHLHQRAALLIVVAGRNIEIAERHAHGRAVDGVVAEQHHAAAVFVGVLRRRQIAVAGQVFAARAHHQVIQGVDIVAAQQVAAVIIAAVLVRRAAQHGAIGLLDLLREHRHAVFQRMVEWLIGDALGHQIGDGDAHRPQQQQGRQHPVEDFAEQRMLDRVVLLRGGRLEPVVVVRLVRWRLARLHLLAGPLAGLADSPASAFRRAASEYFSRQ